jgi:hypothetical protein
MTLLFVGMKTVENDRKTLILVLVLFYNNSTKTKMLRSVYGIEIIGHSKTKKVKTKICRKRPKYDKLVGN